MRFVLPAGLAIYLAYYLTGFKPARIWLLEPSVDTLIEFNRAREVFASGVYPQQASAGNFNAVFPYPPSAVLLFYALGIFGLRVFMAIRMLLMVAGLLITFKASVAGENDDSRAAWLLLGAIALVLCDTPVSWDLRAGNTNLVFLGLILAGYGLLGRRPWLAGSLLALSISLKLFSGLLLLWLLVNGPRAALYAAAIVIAALWIVLPVALFGVGQTVSLYASWREQLRLISGPGVYSFIASMRHGPPLVTVRRAIIVLSGAAPEAPFTRWLLGALWAIWLGAVGWYAARAWRSGHVTAPSRPALADWTVLLLTPLPLSPWLEPYHSVPMLTGAILCLVIVLDKYMGDADRIIAAMALAAVGLMHAVRIPLPIRGFVLLAQFSLLVIAFGLLRPSLAARPASVPPALDL